MQQMKTQDQATSQGTFPVDNQTYNLMQVIVSKLEAIEAYTKYQKDGGQGAQMFQELMQQDTQAVHRLMEQLKQAMR